MILSIPHDAWMNEVERQVRQYKDAPTIEITIDSADPFYNDMMPNTALRVVSAPKM